MHPISRLSSLAAAAALALPLAASAFNPQPDPPGFGLLGVTKIQVFHLSIVNVAPIAETAAASTCTVRVNLVDSRGKVVKSVGSPRAPIAMPPGRAIAVVIAGSDAALAPDGYGRSYLRAVVVPNADEDDCAVASSIEVFDSKTGATGMLMNPGVIRGFNPQPDPPGVVAAPRR